MNMNPILTIVVIKVNGNFICHDMGPKPYHESSPIPYSWAPTTFPQTKLVSPIWMQPIKHEHVHSAGVSIDVSLTKASQL